MIGPDFLPLSAGHEPLVSVVTGTHSAGKSTLVDDLTQGKLTDMGILHHEYEDFGYGVVTQDSTGRNAAVITVPETARWLAELYGRPDLLAENYEFDFQLAIDSLAMARTHEASRLAGSTVPLLISSGCLDEKTDFLRPIVLCDRGPLDGLVYGAVRTGKTDIDTPMHKAGTRVGFAVEWLRSFVDRVIIACHEEVPFEVDEARLADAALRLNIASGIEANYRAHMPEDSILTLHGTRNERRDRVADFLVGGLQAEAHRLASTPFSEWSGVHLVTTG